MSKDPFYEFSKEEQLLHIASEIERARHWQKSGNKNYFLANVERAAKLIDLLAHDSKWSDNRLAVAVLKNLVSKIYSGTESAENVLKVL